MCSCDLIDADNADSGIAEISVDLCRECGKRIGSGRQGSFTQFIFRADTCQCNRPSVPDELLSGDILSSPDSSSSLVQEEVEIEEKEEEALVVEPSSFPVDRYRPLEILGEGGDGKVYKARDLLLNKVVAVKVLARIDSADLLVRFQEEAKATNALNHPAIVSVLDFGVTEYGSPYMVLEYFQAFSMEQVLEERGRLEVETALQAAEAIGSALKYAHGQGICHRDLKPANILINEEGGVPAIKIIDFGLAEVLEEPGMERKEASRSQEHLVGTPFYMCPDQGHGIDYDACSEVYSFGCVFFELLTGEKPFAGENAIHTLNLHASSPAPNLSECADFEFPHSLERIVAKCLAKSREDRYPNFEPLLQDLEVTRQDLSSNLVEEAEGQGPQKTHTSRRGFLAAWILAVLVLSLVGIYIGSLLNEIPDKVESGEVIDIKKKEGFLSETIAPTDEQIFSEKWEEQVAKGGSKVVQGLGMSDESFLQLKGRRDIENLKVGVTDRFTGEGLRYLKGNPLKTLEIHSTVFDDHGAKNLTLFPGLQALHIKFNKVLTEEGMKYVGELENLKLLQIWNCDLPANTFDQIARLKKLNLLDLGDSKPITVAGVKKLSGLSDLYTIQLSGTNDVDDSYIDALNRMKTRGYQLNGSKVSMKTVDVLARRPGTHTLRVSIGDDITIEKLKGYKKRFPQITFTAVDEYNTRIPID